MGFLLFMRRYFQRWVILDMVAISAIIVFAHVTDSRLIDPHNFWTRLRSRALGRAGEWPCWRVAVLAMAVRSASGRPCE